MQVPQSLRDKVERESILSLRIEIREMSVGMAEYLHMWVVALLLVWANK